VLHEADLRGYPLDRRKVDPTRHDVQIVTTSGQIAYEWGRLLQTLKRRNPDRYRQWPAIAAPDPHPLFAIATGPVEPWERTSVARPRR
jgi:hypothetical protein